MKSIMRIGLFLVIILPQTFFSQTVLIDSLQEGGFSLGNTFELNGWTPINTNGVNKWYVGNVPPGFNGNCAYISNNSGASWGYHPTSSNFTAHFYRDIVLPQGVNYMELSFSWANMGEISPNDVLMVSIAPTTFSPSQTNNSAIVLSQPAQTLAVLHNNSTPVKQKIFFHPQVVNTCSSAASIRLIFSFRYNNTAGSNPPPAVDNISLLAHNSPINLSGGTYTVDKNNVTGGTNFSSLGRAIAAINAASQCPVTDTIILNVFGDQTFNEDLPMIAFGGTPTVGLLVKKFGGNENPIVKPNGGSWDKDYGIGLLGAKYVTIDGIDIKVESTNTNIEYGYFIRSYDSNNGSQFNKILNCKIILNKVNTKSIGLYQTTNLGILGYTPSSQAGTNSYNQYKGIKIENSFNGLYLQANNSNLSDIGIELGSTPLSEMIIGGNQINDIGGNSIAYGINSSFQDGVKIQNLIVRNIFTTANQPASGIRFGECTGDIQISRCKIFNISNISTTNANSVIGINILGSGQSASTISIDNCFISEISAAYNGNSSTSYVAGIYISQLNAQSNILFNSIKVISSGRTNTAALYSAQTFAKVKNNILINKTIGSSNLVSHHCFKIGSGGGINSLNFNCYNYDPSGQNTFLIGNSINYSNLAAWKNATGFDLNSVDLLPDFISSVDLHIQGNSFKVDKKGSHIAGILIDIDGSGRDTIMPDIGADDHTPISNGLDMGIYGVSRVNNTGCFRETEELKLLLTNTSILSHNFSLNPVTIAISITGSYSANYSFDISTGILASYQDLYVTVPNSFNFSGGGNIVVTVNLSLTGDVNLYNNEFAQIFSQEIVYGRLTENFNASSSTPNGWSLGAGLTIQPSSGVYSNGLGSNMSSNTNSEFTLPYLGVITASDSLAFDFSVPIVGNWGSIQIFASTNCSSVFLPIDTIDPTIFAGGLNTWKRYRIGLSSFEGEIIKIKFVINAVANGLFSFDNFNLSICTSPPVPTQLQMASTGFYSITGSYTPQGADGHLVVRYNIGSLPTIFPQNYREYQVGEQIGTGLIISNNSISTFSDSGLQPEQTYNYYIYPYFGSTCAGGPIYNTSSLLWGSVSTNACAVSGLKRIGTSNDDFTSVTAALNYINTYGIHDTTILELQTDYIPENKITFIPMVCNDSSRVIVIRPAVNVTNDIVFMRTPGSLGAYLTFNNANGIIIDGRPGGQGSSSKMIFSITNGTSVEFMAGSKNIKLQYLKLQGYSNNNTVPVIKFDSCSYISLKENDIGNPSIMSESIIATSTYTTYINILNNKIFNFSKQAIEIYRGIYIKIIGNSFYYTIVNSSTNYDIRAINIFSSPNFIIKNNTIGGTLPNGMGSYMTIGTLSETNPSVGTFTGVYALYASTGGVIESNHIRNIKILSSGGGFTGLYCLGDQMQIHHNTIGDLVDTASIKFDFVNSQIEYSIIGINSKGVGTTINIDFDVMGNYVSNLSAKANSSLKLNFFGIKFDAQSQNVHYQIDSNIISNINFSNYGYGYGLFSSTYYNYTNYNLYVNSVANNIINNIRSDKGGFCAIHSLELNQTTQITDNSVSYIICGDTTGVPVNRLAIGGIYAEGRQTIFNNLINNLKYNNSGEFPASICAINAKGYWGILGSISLQRNRIYGIYNYSTSTKAEINGIKLENQEFNLFNNIINIKLANSPKALAIGLNVLCKKVKLFNNSFKMGDFRSDLSLSYLVFLNEDIETAEIKGNVLINVAKNNNIFRKNYCIGATKFKLEKNILFKDNIFDYDVINGGIFKFDQVSIDGIANFRQYFNKDETSHFCDPGISEDSTSVIPLTVNRLEGSGNELYTNLDYYGFDRNLLSPHDVGAIAGNFFNTNADLSIKADISYVGCDSMDVRYFIKNMKNSSYSFNSYPLQLIIKNKSSQYHFQNFEILHQNGIIEGLKEDTFHIRVPQVYLGNCTLEFSISSSADPVGLNNVCRLNYFYRGGSGQFTIGKAGDFYSLTEAVDFYNKNTCMDGDISFILIDTLYDSKTEDFPINFNRDYSITPHNLTIKPLEGLNVKIFSDIFDGPVFIFRNTNKIKLNGIDTVGPTTLSILNNSENYPCIELLRVNKEIEIVSCLISGKNYESQGLVSLDSLRLPGLTISFEKCIFQPLNNALVSYMVAVGQANPNTIGSVGISNCYFKNYLSCGIYGYFASTYLSITDCEFESPLPKATELRAIYVAGKIKVEILRNHFDNHQSSNYIYILAATSDTVHVVGNTISNYGFPGSTFPIHGISVEYSNYVVVKNNMVSLGWTGNQTGGVFGLLCRSNDYEYINSNSILLLGNFTGNNSVTSFYSVGSLTSSYVHNNLFVNGVNSTTNTCAAVTNFPQYLMNYNNNVYVSKNLSGGTCFIHNNNVYTFANWKNLFFNPDAQSFAFVSGIVGGGLYSEYFLNYSNLHLGNSDNSAINSGTSLYLPNQDIDLNYRNNSSPDIGADEVANICEVAPVPAINGSDFVFCSKEKRLISSNAYNFNAVGLSFQWQYRYSGQNLYSTVPTNAARTDLLDFVMPDKDTVFLRQLSLCADTGHDTISNELVFIKQKNKVLSGYDNSYGSLRKVIDCSGVYDTVYIDESLDTVFLERKLSIDKRIVVIGEGFTKPVITTDYSYILSNFDFLVGNQRNMFLSFSNVELFTSNPNIPLLYNAGKMNLYNVLLKNSLKPLLAPISAETVVEGQVNIK